MKDEHQVCLAISVQIGDRDWRGIARFETAPAWLRFTPSGLHAGKDKNGAPFDQYFPILTHRVVALEPLRLTQTADVYDVDATLDGGGVSGQAGALRLGIARALIALDEEARPGLKKAGLLTRDAREKERRKYGLKKARKAPQYSKR